MERLAIAGALIAVAVVIALLARRKQPDAPTPTGWAVPTSVDRSDFSGADRPWLVAVFTSATCDTCAAAWAKTQPLESDQVAIAEVEVVAQAELHTRYGIEAVPTVVMADAAGVVRASFLGPPTAADLWATMAELREPGSTPDGCDHGATP